MVGVGIEGKESSLARVSLVNYHGVVQLDEFVRQREHVVDYRTEFSGVRASDMVNGAFQIYIYEGFGPNILIMFLCYSKAISRSSEEGVGSSR